MTPMSVATEMELSTMGYDDLPLGAKSQHDEIAEILGLSLNAMTEYDVLLAIVRRIQALEAKNETQETPSSTRS